MSRSVPEVGLEPTRPEEHEILSLACLPIPPFRPVYRIPIHWKKINIFFGRLINKKRAAN